MGLSWCVASGCCCSARRWPGWRPGSSGPASQCASDKCSLSCDAALPREGPSLVRQGDYDLQSSLEPGTDVITVEVSAQEGVPLDPFVAAYSRAASRYVNSVYKAYTLEFLEATSVPSGGAAAREVQITGLAALAGALLGLLIVFAEYKLRGLDILEAREDVAPPTGDAMRRREGSGESPLPDRQEADLDPQAEERGLLVDAGAGSRERRPG